MGTVINNNIVKKYSSYKDSGTEWMREIPKHWELTRLKNIFYESIKQNENGKCTFYLSVLKDIGVIPFSEKGNKGNKTSLDTRNYRLVEKGDIVLNTTNVCIGSVGLSKYDGCLSSVMYIVLRPIVELDIKYYDYFFKVREFQKYLRRISNGILEVREYLDKTLFKAELFIFPPLPEQIAIAAFLDRKIVLIDQAINIKQKQIELLKERSQILIYKAVTRGLNPNVKMKDSGVEWIGEIPEGWKVKKVKHITTKIGSGVTPFGGGTTYLESGIPFLRSQNILFGKIELEGVAFISDKIHATMANSQVRKGDVLLNITGGSIGRCHYVDFDAELNVNQHVCIIRPTKEITTLFLNSILSSEIGQGQIWFNQQGGGREGLNFQSIKNFFLPLPPIVEQKIICDYIVQTTKRFATAISLKEQEIEKLKEYKGTLINSAVTGKIKVSATV